MSSLKGKTIIATCADQKAKKMKGILSSQGVNFYSFPLIRTEPASDNRSNIQAILSEINSFHWIVFTSTNGVDCFFKWINEFEIALDTKGVKFATIGEATAHELKKYGVEPTFVGQSKDAVEFGNQLAEHFVSPGQKVLLPVGNMAMKGVESVLKADHVVEALVVYNTYENQTENPLLETILQNDPDSLVLFLSPSAVRAFVKSTAHTYANIKAVPIGQTTNSELNKLGMKSILVPGKPDIETMLFDIENYFKIKK